jgi:3',5'-cyclic-AMP phosphodiesterase
MLGRESGTAGHIFFRIAAAVLLFVLISTPESSAQARSLNKIPEQAEAKLQFAVISDVHVQHGNPLSGTRLREALLDFREIAPNAKALVLNGDLGNGRQEDYEALSKVMEALPHPEKTFYTIGNHEFYKAWVDSAGRWNPDGFPNGDTDAGAIGRFLSFTGYSNVYRDEWLEGYHLLFLGSEAYRQTKPDLGEEAWLSDEQLGWLESSLRIRSRTAHPVFVFLHQPIPGTIAGSIPSASVHPKAALRYTRLKEIIAKYPQAILFTGHSHMGLGLPRTVEREGFTMVNTSSVYEPLSEDELPYGETDRRSEGLLVEVYKDEVRIRGRNFAQKAWVPEADYKLHWKKGLVVP